MKKFNFKNYFEDKINSENIYGTRFRDRFFAPWYDKEADYNTNAKSYYDYLSRLQALLRSIIDSVNKLFKRSVEVQDTSTIDMTKVQDWNEVQEGKCDKLENLKDETIIKASIIFSKETVNQNLAYIGDYVVTNGSVDKTGLWSPDYKNALNLIDNSLSQLDDRVTINEGDIANIKNDINNIKNDLTNLTNNFNNFAENQEKYNNFIEQIYNNLVTDGGYTGEMGDGSLTAGLAYGTINFFGGTVDGASYIRTNKGTTENDVTAGIV